MFGRKRLLLVVVAAVVVGVAVFLASVRGAAGLAGAIAVVRDESRFESSPEAGDAFAVVAELLVDEARGCSEEHSKRLPICVARSEAAAYVQTLAVIARGCTGPGIYEMRSRTLDYLRALERMGDDADRRPPVPSIAPC